MEYRKPDPSRKQYNKPRKWTDDDITRLLQCLQEHGHKDFSKLEEYLPYKTLEDIKAYFRATKAKAADRATVPGLDNWLNICDAEARKHRVAKYSDSNQIAQVVKYLSVDGLVENHPLPEQCQGIDFPAAYRLLYQALMGYPMQPVNKETAAFIDETFKELGKTVAKSPDFDVVKTHLKEIQSRKNTGNDCPAVYVPFKTVDVPNLVVDKKPIKTYQRKKKIEKTNATPVISLPIESSEQESMPCSSQMQSTIDESSGCSNMNLPVANNNNDVIKELYDSISFNPFQIPERWLKGDFSIKTKKN